MRIYVIVSLYGGLYQGLAHTTIIKEDSDVEYERLVRSVTGLPLEEHDGDWISAYHDYLENVGDEEYLQDHFDVGKVSYIFDPVLLKLTATGWEPA